MTIWYFSGTAGDVIDDIPYDVRHALTGNLEIEFVFRMDEKTPLGSIISFGGYDNGGIETSANNVLYSVFLSSPRKLSVFHEYGNGTEYQADGTTELPLDWLRVRVVRSGLTYSIYVNGNLYLQSSFLSNQAPSFGVNMGAASRIRIGATYFNLTARNTLTRVSIAYVKVKNASNVVVYELGEDPGGAPGTNKPFIGATIFDPFSHAVARPVQHQLGAIDFDAFGGIFERKPQRGIGYILDMTGAGGGNTAPAEIIPPRAYPLEGTWKKANPTSFNN